MAIFQRKAVVGMVHVGALPGTPRQQIPLLDIVRAAADEARILAGAGFDGLIVENMHDLPYLAGGVGPEIVAAMTAICIAVRSKTGIPLGVQILAGANREALAVAHAAGAQFIRVENFVYAHVADEGLMPRADAGPLLRFRRQIGAESVAILADVKKKHASHAITADLSIVDAAIATEQAGAAGVIVTGSATGRPASIDELRAVRSGCGAMLCIGSGISADNLPEYWPLADVFIVGSSLKHNGAWAEPVDPRRADEFMSVVTRLRQDTSEEKHRAANHTRRRKPNAAPNAGT